MNIPDRSRTKVPRPEDTAAGVGFLKFICYPHINQYIDSKQEMGKQLNKKFYMRISFKGIIIYAIMHKNIIKNIIQTIFYYDINKFKNNMLTCGNLFADCVPDEHKPKQTKY